MVNNSTNINKTNIETEICDSVMDLFVPFSEKPSKGIFIFTLT